MSEPRRLRIAMIGTRGLPATYGGVERHVEEIGSRLVERGHSVTVFCRSNYAEEHLDEYRGMQLVHLSTPESKHLEALVHSGRAALAAARGHQFDVVHFHAVGPGIFTPVSRFVGRQAVVQTIHGLDQNRAKWGLLASTLIRVSGWVSAKTPHVVIGCSQDLADHYRAHYEVDARYVNNGFTPPGVVGRSDVRQRLGLDGHRYVLFVGRFVPEKAPDALIEAFRAIDDPDLRLVLAGGSSFTSEFAASLKALAGDDPRIIFPGYVFGDDLADLYANAAVFVLPSKLEGLPLTLLEASSYGVPVVVSDIPPHCEVVERDAPGARLVPPADAGAIRRAILETLDDPSATLGAQHLRDRVVATYEWDRATRGVERAYFDAIERATGVPAPAEVDVRPSPVVVDLAESTRPARTEQVG